MKKLLLLLLIVKFFQPINAEAQIVNKVIAVINNEVITQQDVDRLLSVLYAQYVHEYKGDELLEKMEEVRKDILKRMIEDKLILSRAKELDIKVAEKEIKEKLELVKGGFARERDFLDTLDAQGVTLANLKDRYRDQILIKKIVDWEIKTRVTVLPSEITEYYEAHREQFKQGEKYRVRHILVKADNTVAFVLSKIEIRNVYNKLVKGKDFSELARKYSEGPNKDQGGDMGYIGPGEMLDELDTAIFKLKPGEYSDIIKTNIGYHIVKVEDIAHSGYLSLEQVQKNIKAFIFQRKFQKKLTEWLAELSKNAYISLK